MMNNLKLVAGYTAEINTAYSITFIDGLLYCELVNGSCLAVPTEKVNKLTFEPVEMVYIVYRDKLGICTVKADTSIGIKFTDGGFIEYATETELVQDDVKNIIEIYFE